LVLHGGAGRSEVRLRVAIAEAYLGAGDTDAQASKRSCVSLSDAPLRFPIAKCEIAIGTESVRISARKNSHAQF
jgi:hypothetical protein